LARASLLGRHELTAAAAEHEVEGGFFEKMHGEAVRIARVEAGGEKCGGGGFGQWGVGNQPSRTSFAPCDLDEGFEDLSVGSDRKCATVDQLPGGDSRGGGGRIGHRVVAGPGGSQGEVWQGFHLEAVVGTAGEKPRGGNGRGRKIFREEKDDGERLFASPSSGKRESLPPQKRGDR
jgi:hypothetical protein